MTPKNKKFLKKKRNNKCHKNANSSVDIKMPRVKRNCLSLIERMAFRLKEDSSGKLVTILEGIFSIFKVDPKKKPARLELINSLLSNVKEYETKDINSLRDQLNTVFFPKELKKLMVDASDLLEIFNPFLLLGLGVFKDDPYLIKKDGSKIRVEIKRARDVKDEQALIREAKTLSQLHHENIIKILAFDKAGRRFATEYMKLGNLEDALMKYHFTCRKMFEALKDVASAMAYLAAKGYVLRNLKTENVLQDAEGVCKIGDFRYCRYVGDDPDGTYMEEDTTLATEYAAPEVRQEGRFSTKSDVWDFALVACEVFNVNPHRASTLVCPENIRPVYIDMFLSVEVFPMPVECPYPLWTYLQTELIEADPKKRPTFAEILRELKEYDDWDIDP